MSLGKLDFRSIQEKWRKKWEDEGVYAFDAKSKNRVYSIDSPPPFTSGALHMGHVLSYSYFDFAARFHRMNGFNVLYPQGWDCQGFPTEVKVEKKYGYGKLSREEFKQKCIEFTLENIDKMKNQMQEMGFSPDWRLEYRTISPDYHKTVQLSLLQMFEKGLVYKKKHPVLFCFKCSSAIAKAETEEVEKKTNLNTVIFKTSEDSELHIATTRPELLHACVAVAINPLHPKYKKFIGGFATTPFFNKVVPIIPADEVEVDFGTGAVMVCSFGDKQDAIWIYRHNLPIIDAMNTHGRIINAGAFDGLKLEEFREKILNKLREIGVLVKQDPHVGLTKVHDRCKTPIDLLASEQWFIKVKEFKSDIVAAARQINWVPDFSIQYLIDWAEGLEWDWVISRQNVFGTPLPFWTCEACGDVRVAKETELPVDPALDLTHRKCKCGGVLRGETSVCDCWVDSSITPLVIAGWPDKGWEKKYPSSLRPQGLEIIRTWSFYTIFRCLKLTGKPPFDSILINGSVLGTDGKKMSKSLGNYEDPDVLLKKYSADALRQWAALSGAFAKDRPFSYKDVDYSQSFLNKVWNAARFVETVCIDYVDSKKLPALSLVDKWMLQRLSQSIEASTTAWKKYDYYSAINALHQFFWRDYCDYYLEDVKHRVYGSDAESKLAAQYTLRIVLRDSLKLLAPFAPFTTEELWRALFGKQSIHESEWPTIVAKPDESVLRVVDLMHSIISDVRRVKAEKQMALNAPIPLAKIECNESKARDIGAIEEDLKAVTKISVLEVKVSDVDGCLTEF